MMVLAGVGWVIATSFFRSVVDPWFNAYPLLSALVMATVLLTYATILLLAGSNFGKPLPEKRRGRSLFPPPLRCITFFNGLLSGPFSFFQDSLPSA